LSSARAAVRCWNDEHRVQHHQQPRRPLLFVPSSFSGSSHHRTTWASSSSAFVLRLAIDDDDASAATTSGRKRTRRKRKRSKTDGSDASEQAAVVLDDATQSSSSTTMPELQTKLQPREDKAVNLEVADVRDLVSGRRSAASSTSTTASGGPTSSSTQKGEQAASSSSSGSVDESLQRLLEDAKEMKALEEEKKGDGSISAGFGGDNVVDGGEGFSIPKAVQSALSTIITADFFLICFFLLWFLAGIFSSYVVKDDTIQIAFNNIFQPVVQPALGVLMIGSIMSSVFEDDDEGGDGGGAPMM